MLTEIFDYPSLYDPYDWPTRPQTLGSRQVTPPSEGRARISERQGLALFIQWLFSDGRVVNTSWRRQFQTTDRMVGDTRAAVKPIP